MLADWNNSLRADWSLHSDKLSWFRANQPLLFLLNDACNKYRFNSLWSYSIEARTHDKFSSIFTSIFKRWTGGMSPKDSLGSLILNRVTQTESSYDTIQHFIVFNPTELWQTNKDQLQ